MMKKMRIKWFLVVIFLGGFLSPLCMSAEMAIIFDDFGYRLKEENLIINQFPPITVAVLPNAPYAEKVMKLAKAKGHEIILHLPMQPLSPQPLEKDTLKTTMDENEIRLIIDEALLKVPDAVGVNNHMGSAMTSDLLAMKRVMSVLQGRDLFFLDSQTVSHSQVSLAAQNYGINVLKRDVFLDNEMSEQAISKQFKSAILIARKKGKVIIIGHPHAQTISVVQEQLKQLPDDIIIVPLKTLLEKNGTQDKVDNNVGEVTGENEPDSPISYDDNY